jgi:hypothetical protein
MPRQGFAASNDAPTAKLLANLDHKSHSLGK